ncbi:MAG: prolyl oligopeptidase family serine peptidase [Mesorhizobium sp.]
MTTENGRDPYLWLEERESPEALKWVGDQNKVTTDRLHAVSGYEQDFATALDLMTAEDNLAVGSELHGKVYNFWQDKTNPLGLWRRTSLASYKTEKPDWETILDFDRLAAEEGTKWVFSGAIKLYPDFTRALIMMSPDGGDASAMREFDIEAKAFVVGGFEAPASKSGYTWLDIDTLLVSSALTDDDRTTSGYPRVVRLWKRGEPLMEAAEIFDIPASELTAYASVDHDRGKQYVFASRVMDFYNGRGFLRMADGSFRHIPLPDDSLNTVLFKGQFIFGQRTPWTAPNGTKCEPDGLYAFDFEHWIATGELGAISTILKPRDRVSIAGLATTETRVFVQMMDNVRGKVIAASHDGKGWLVAPVALPDNGNVGIVGANSYGTSVCFSFTDFLTPPSLIWSDDEGATLETIKAQPARFDASGLVTEQFEAKSKDGTMIPYFVVRPKNQSRPLPTLLYAYGGFQVPLLPGYAGVRGKLWLERGNVFVQASIRGGGEFGPNWHIAALKGNRQTAFDDFAAVAEDLAKRRITTPSLLAINGGSNGGLLTGTAVTQRPELYGAAIIEVPLLDMLRYTELPPGASWIAEYGDPSIPEERAFLEAYSPYQHVRDGVTYPNVLLMTSTADDRVHPGHARKMAALMQAKGNAGTLYYEETQGGHGGRGDRKPQAAQAAMRFAFLRDVLGESSA